MRSKQHWKYINMADFDSKVGNFKTTFEFSDSLWGGAEYDFITKNSNHKIRTGNPFYPRL